MIKNNVFSVIFLCIFFVHATLGAADTNKTLHSLVYALNNPNPENKTAFEEALKKDPQFVGTIFYMKKTPLTEAASYGATPFVKMLIQNGADINLKDASGITPLVEATKSSSHETVQLLISEGADVNLNSDGFTALHAAVISSEIKCVQALLAVPTIDLTILYKKPDGFTAKTAFEFAQEANNPDILKLFDEKLNGPTRRMMIMGTSLIVVVSGALLYWWQKKSKKQKNSDTESDSKTILVK